MRECVFSCSKIFFSHNICDIGRAWKIPCYLFANSVISFGSFCEPQNFFLQKILHHPEIRQFFCKCLLTSLNIVRCPKFKGTLSSRMTTRLTPWWQVVMYVFGKCQNSTDTLGYLRTILSAGLDLNAQIFFDSFDVHCRTAQTSSQVQSNFIGWSFQNRSSLLLKQLSVGARTTFSESPCHKVTIR